MSRILDIIWPTLDDWKLGELRERWEKSSDEIEAIRTTSWGSAGDNVALEEARRLAAAEEERRKTAETKATTYLLFAGGLLSLLTYLESIVWTSKVGVSWQWLSLILLASAIAYLIAAGVWSIRALKVDTFHQVDVEDLLAIWSRSEPNVGIVSELLIAVRKNRDGINAKVSCLKQAEQFMIRSFVVFGVLVIAAVVWKMWSLL